MTTDIWAPRCSNMAAKWLMIGLRWPQNGPKMAPRWLQEGPRWPQVGPKGPKMAPGWPRMAPRWPQDGPKMAPGGTKMAQGTPKMAQNGPKMAQSTSRWPQDGPKMAPSWPQEGPQRPQNDVRTGLKTMKKPREKSIFWLLEGILTPRWRQVSPKVCGKTPNEPSRWLADHFATPVLVGTDTF